MAQVFRVERNKNFTVMSNHHFKNKDLSLKTHIATNQPGKCGIISILLILYKIEYSRCNADSSNDK